MDIFKGKCQWDISSNPSGLVSLASNHLYVANAEGPSQYHPDCWTGHETPTLTFDLSVTSTLGYTLH